MLCMFVFPFFLPLLSLSISVYERKDTPYILSVDLELKFFTRGYLRAGKCRGTSFYVPILSQIRPWCSSIYSSNSKLVSPRQHGYSAVPTQNHGIIECFGLEGTFRGHLVPTTLQWAGTSSIRAGCSGPHPTWSWIFPRMGLHYPSGQNPFQRFTTLTVKNFFLISCPNLPSLSLKPLLLVLLQQVLLKNCSYLSYRPPSGTDSCNQFSLQPSLLQAEQPQLSQPVLIGEVLQPSNNFCCPPLDPSNSSMSFLCWRFQSWTQHSKWGLTRAE